jgi:hypothetical protein
MVCTPARDAGERQTKAVSTWSAHSLQINRLLVERPAAQPVQVKLEAALPHCGSRVSIV